MRPVDDGYAYPPHVHDAWTVLLVGASPAHLVRSFRQFKRQMGTPPGRYARSAGRAS